MSKQKIKVKEVLKIVKAVSNFITQSCEVCADTNLSLKPQLSMCSGLLYVINTCNTQKNVVYSDLKLCLNGI